MQNLDNLSSSIYAEISAFKDCPEEAEDTVVFELVVPQAAKVPAARLHIEIARLVVQQASVCSTATAGALTELRVNNTARSTAWSITATLAATRPLRR